jgi:hypothetical protein
MTDDDLAQYHRLSPSVKEWLLEKVVARLSAEPPFAGEEEALAAVRAALPQQLMYERKQHKDDPILPLPDGYTVRVCRCRALTYVHARSLSILCPLTLAKHWCADVPMRGPDPQAVKLQRQYARDAGRRSLAATRQPRRIGLGSDHAD